jgi:hypothetical protein
MPFVFKDGSTAGTCSVCGAPAWSIRSNKCNDHRSATPYKSKSKKGKPSVKSDGSPDGKSIVTQVVETAGAIDANTFKGRPPTASEWEDKLASLVVLATMTYVEYVVVKPLHLPEPDATQAVALLGMTDEEARTIVEPGSYLLGRSAINKKHGREAIEILAFAPAILAIVQWADRVSSFRSQIEAARQSGQLGGPSFVSDQGAEAAPGPVRAPIANFGGGDNFDPGKAPTAGLNGSRAHVDEQDRPVSA